MTQKTLFCMAVLATQATTQLLADPILLDMNVYYDEHTDNSGQHRSPIQLPLIGIEDNTLYFYTPCDGLELRLVDENGNVVFVTTIPSSCVTLDLPSELEGSYELRLVFDNNNYYYFYGDITL